MRSRAFRRHKANAQMRRRLTEDRNQHYDNLRCLCWTDLGTMARFKEQPKRCSKPWCCGNPRRDDWATLPERRTMPERRAGFGLRLEVNQYGEDVWVR